MKRIGIYGTMVILVLVFAMALVPVRPARADGGALIWYWLLGQIMNDMRQQSVERHNIGFNPSANVFDPRENFVGSVADLRDTVSAVGLGAIVKVSSGATSTGVIVAHRVSCDEEDFPYAVGIYREDLDKLAKNGKEVRERDFAKGATKSVAVDCNKWSVSIDTARFTHRMYACVLRTYYIDVEPSGLLRLGRKAVVRYQETVFKFLVRDAKYLAMAINDPKLQRDLMMSAGLVGGPEQLAIPRFEVNSQVKDEVARPYGVDGSLLPITPTPPHVEVTERTEVTTATGTPQPTPPSFEITPKPATTFELPSPKPIENATVKPEVKGTPKETSSSPVPQLTAVPEEVKTPEAIVNTPEAPKMPDVTATPAMPVGNLSLTTPPVIAEKKCGTVSIAIGEKGCVYVWEISPNDERTQTKMFLSGRTLYWRDSDGKSGTLVYDQEYQKGKIQFKCQIGTVIRIRLEGTDFWTSPKTVGEDAMDGTPLLQYNFKVRR